MTEAKTEHMQDPLLPRSQTIVDGAGNWALLRAQLVATSYLHSNLPMYPAAWVIQNTQKDFIYVYIHERKKYTFLEVCAWFFFFSFCFPLIACHTVVSYRCAEAKWDVEAVQPETGEPLKTFRGHMTGCQLEDFLRSPWRALTVSGPVLLFISVLTSVVIISLFALNRHLQKRVMGFAKYVLPNVFYNGLGPARSDHSMWHILQKRQLQHYWNFLHDSLGNLDIIVCCLSLSFTMVAYFTLMGFFLHGVAGAGAGATAGSVIGRFMLLMLNYRLGASPRMISFINEHLRGFQPYKRVMDLTPEVEDQYLKEDQVKTEVQRAADMVRSKARKTAERRGGKEVEGVEELARRIEDGGFEVVSSVVKWLWDHRASLFAVQHVCRDLFDATDTFASNEYAVASLALMDIPIFLATYFDPDWSVLGQFVRYNGEAWTIQMKLSTVYSAFPRQLLCKQASAGPWRVTRVSNEQALEELESQGR